MFGSLGIQEILLILALALLIFGPRRLPELGKTIGRALAEFRRASNDVKSTIEREINKVEEEEYVRGLKPGDDDKSGDAG